MVQVAAENVDLVDEFVYLGSSREDVGPTCSLWVRDMDRQQDPGKASRCLQHLVSAENFTDSVHQAHYK